MSIDELSVMDGGKCILQLRGVRPFLSEKFDITKHKNYRFLSDADPKNTFNIERFVSTRLNVKPDEKYTHYEHIVTDEEMPQEAMNDFQQPDSEESVDDSQDHDFEEEDLTPL